MTCLNGMFNGNLSTYSYGYVEEESGFTKNSLFSRIIPEVSKYLMILQNFVVKGQSLNKPHEAVKKFLKKVGTFSELNILYRTVNG